MNILYYYGWTLRQFLINGETYTEAYKPGTSIAIKGDMDVLTDQLDSLDFLLETRYIN